MQWSIRKLTGGDKKGKAINSKEVLTYFRTVSKVLVTGSDDSGKTALLKTLFIELSAEYVPLLVSGEDLQGKITEASFRKIVVSAIEQQYDSTSVERFLQLDPDRRILLLDDFHKSNLTRQNEIKLMALAESIFGRVFITAADVYRMRPLTRKAAEEDRFQGL